MMKNTNTKIIYIGDKIFYVESSTPFGSELVLLVKEGTEFIDGNAYFPSTISIPKETAPKKWSEFISFLWSLRRGPILRKERDDIIVPGNVPKCPVCTKPFRLLHFYYCPDCRIVVRGPAYYNERDPLFRQIRESQPNTEWVFVEEMGLFMRPISEETVVKIQMHEEILHQRILLPDDGTSGERKVQE